MKSEIKAKWVGALRSGEYKQTTGALRDEDGFCCLGVLCEVAVAEGVIRPGRETKHGYFVYGRESAEILPSTVAKWAGIQTNPEVLQGQLSALNDRGFDFVEIADIIDADL